MALIDKGNYEDISNLVGIRVDSSESIEGALKRFKKDCERSGIMSEMKKRQYFEKPSVTKKRKNDAVDRKRRKKITRQGSYK